MIGRKLVMVQNGDVISREAISFEPSYLEELKNVFLENTKKYSYVGLVLIIRLYVRFTNFLKSRYQEIKNSFLKNDIEGEKKEISKFLKIISDYKQRIRRIKHKIREEEKIL